MTLLHQCKLCYSQKPHILTFTIEPFIFLLQSLHKIIWINIQYFRNAPRRSEGAAVVSWLSSWFAVCQVSSISVHRLWRSKSEVKTTIFDIALPPRNENTHTHKICRGCSSTFSICQRSYHEFIGQRTQLKTQKVNFLVFQKFYFNFAVVLSKFIKTYILLNFIQYYKKFLRRNHMFYHYT